MKNRCMPMRLRAFVAFMVAVFGLTQFLHAQELKLQKTLGAKEDGVSSAVFSPEGQKLAVWARNSFTAVLWDVPTAKSITVKDLSGVLAFTPDGKTLIGWSGDHFSHQFTVYDTAGGKAVVTFKKKAEAPVAFSPDGKYLAYAYPGHGEALDFVELTTAWDMNSVKPVSSIPKAVGKFAYFAPDARSVIAETGTRTITQLLKDASLGIWDVATGKQLATISGQIPVKGLVFSPDGKSFAAPSIYQVKIWSTATGKSTMILGERTGKSPTDFVKFSMDGKRLASVDGGGGVKLWDVASGKLIAAGSVTGRALAFSPDLKLVAVAARDGTLELREMPAGAAGKK